MAQDSPTNVPLTESAASPSPSNKQAANQAKAAEAVKAGDPVLVRVVVGGPIVQTWRGKVLRVSKQAPTGRKVGPLLDILVSSPNGVESELLGLAAEPPEGAKIDHGGHIFPCWARTSA
jgi:hypothetical protein